MERLTIKTEAGYDKTNIRVKNQQLIDKLAYYENLEEQGLLMKLPCKDVYFIADAVNPKYAMVMKTPISELTIYEIKGIDKDSCEYFSTEDKAEAELKELRGGIDDNRTCNCQHNSKPRDNKHCCRCDSRQTNADRIRNMSDEELADYLTTIQEAYSCPCDYDGWLEELQSEAE